MTRIATALVHSSAPASSFFARWADVATWPDWNADTEWVRLDGPFQQGATGTLKPKGGPKVSFRVERLTETEFIDVSRMPGARVTFAHHIHETDEGTEVEVSVDIDGPLAFVWTRILGGGFRKSLQPDLNALARVVERDVAATA